MNHDSLVSAQIISDEAAFAQLKPEWSELFAASAQAATPLQFDWLEAWWQIYGPAYGARNGMPGNGSLRVVTVRRGDRLIGGLPLYAKCSRGSALDVRRLSFLSTGEDEHEEVCPDYLNFLCLPGEEETCVDELSRILPQLNWDQLELPELPENSPLIEHRHLFNGLGPGELIPRGNCPIANLEGGFHAYLQRLSSNSRQQARRLLREAESCGVQFEIASAGNAGQFFDELIGLHQARWNAEGKSGCFAAARFTAFHRALIGKWVATGQAILARLSLNGETVAVLYGFATGSKFDFYQCGVNTDQAGPLRSPGNLAHLLLMQHVCHRGLTTYDFLRGDSSYKTRLATGHNDLVTLQIWRHSFRATVYRSSKQIGREIRNRFASFLRR